MTDQQALPAARLHPLPTSPLADQSSSHDWSRKWSAGGQCGRLLVIMVGYWALWSANGLVGYRSCECDQSESSQGVVG